ncbi:voltage-gated ion channel [Pseudoscourfieldia marina]
MMADHHHTPAAAQVSGAQVTEKRISDTGATVDTSGHSQDEKKSVSDASNHHSASHHGNNAALQPSPPAAARSPQGANSNSAGSSPNAMMSPESREGGIEPRITRRPPRSKLNISPTPPGATAKSPNSQGLIDSTLDDELKKYDGYSSLDVDRRRRMHQRFFGQVPANRMSSDKTSLEDKKNGGAAATSPADSKSLRGSPSPTRNRHNAAWDQHRQYDDAPTPTQSHSSIPCISWTRRQPAGDDFDEDHQLQQLHQTKHRRMSASVSASTAANAVFFDPRDNFRLHWDALMALCVCYNCLIVPVRIGFSEKSKWSPLAITDLVIDLLFLLDIFLNFHTGFDDAGYVLMDRKLVRRKYLTTWFTFDLISSFPFDMLVIITASSAASSNLLLYLRLPRLLRLLRLPRLFRYMSKWEHSFTISNSSALRMIKLVFFILFFAHLNACLQFFAADLEHFPTDGWVVREDLLNRSNFVRYTHALFKSLSHMLCIGYGLYPPYTVAELWITMLSMCIGASFYAALVGIMSTLIMNMDRSGALYEQMVEQWKEYFRFRRLDPTLRTRILRFFENTWRTRKLFSERDLLAELPPNLRTDIAMNICGDLVEKVPLFKVVNPVVAMMLVPLMEPVSLMTGELVYREKEIADEMFFISSGEIQIESAAGVVFTTLGAGSYFGEFSFLYDASPTRTAHARAIVVTQLFSLSRDGFQHVSRVYPELKFLMLQIADARTAVFKAKARKVAAAKEAESRRTTMSDGDSGKPSRRQTRIVDGQAGLTVDVEPAGSADAGAGAGADDAEMGGAPFGDNGDKADLPVSPTESKEEAAEKEELLNQDFMRALETKSEPQSDLKNLASAAVAGRRWKKAAFKIAAVAQFGKSNKVASSADGAKEQEESASASAEQE